MSYIDHGFLSTFIAIPFLQIAAEKQQIINSVFPSKRGWISDPTHADSRDLNCAAFAVLQSCLIYGWYRKIISENKKPFKGLANGGARTYNGKQRAERSPDKNLAPYCMKLL